MTVEELINQLLELPLDAAVLVVFSQQEPISGFTAETPAIVVSQYRTVYLTADYDKDDVGRCDKTGRGWI